MTTTMTNFPHPPADFEMILEGDEFQTSGEPILEGTVKSTMESTMETTMETTLRNSAESHSNSSEVRQGIHTGPINANRNESFKENRIETFNLAELDFIETTDLATEGTSVASSPSMSLPAALCDELLLEEINSIPDKMGFKIGDVADLLGIKQYVLRYWESEFEILRPRKAANNQRMYSRKDVENAFLIRKLLHRDRFSIEGARNALKELKAHVRKEKDYTQAFVRLENFQERIEDLAREIRGVRQLFK